MDLRIGIIGLGMRGTELARDAHRPGEGSRIVAVCEVTERGRAAAASDYPDAVITDDLDELLAQNLDAAMVFTPDDVHARTAIPALEAGLAVFSEKPLATSISDCDAILAAAHRTGSRLYVGHNMRHMPVVSLMRDIIARGTIGEVKAVWCRHFVGHGGDYYFKDWHAERSKSVGMLLQKGAHDIDVIHWLAGAYTTHVQAMGALAVYGDVTDRRDRTGELMGDWFSLDNWPPTEQTGLNPVIDIEDISQVNMRLQGGVLASYEQCHFTPDYWRNYTVIGTHGRLENFGDESGSEVGVWTHRLRGSGAPDETHVVPEAEGGHGGADSLMIDEFLRFAREGGPTTTSPVAARNAVAAGVLATQSIRGNGSTVAIPPVDTAIAAYFDADDAAQTAQ